MTYDEISGRYGKRYLTDKQLDGMGAAEGDLSVFRIFSIYPLSFH